MLDVEPVPIMNEVLLPIMLEKVLLVFRKWGCPPPKWIDSAARFAKEKILMDFPPFGLAFVDRHIQMRSFSYRLALLLVYKNVFRVDNNRLFAIGITHQYQVVIHRRIAALGKALESGDVGVRRQLERRHIH